MVEQVTINPTEVRGYGNICEGHTLEDFIVSNSGLAKEKEDVHGALTEVYKLVYSVYGLMFDFDKGNKQLYLQMSEADTLSFGFDTANKQLYLVDENDTGFNLGFDEDTNELYITDDAPPIVHNYSLAFDQSSYTTSGSLSVSATLLDDGVAVEGATVSFTGGDSAVTATTNSSGVATATVTFTSSGTLTASYSNVSDTATVTVQSYLFYDACDSASGLTNYGASQVVRGSTATITMSYDSTENAYKVAGSGNYHAMIPITPLADKDEYIISMDCKGQAIRYNMVGFFLDDSANTTSYGLCFGLDIGKADNAINQSLYSRLYRPNSDGTGYITFLNSNVLTGDTWYKMTFTVNGDTLTGALYDGTTKLAEKTVTHTINNKQMGILLFCEKGTTQSACYVKNIKAEVL